MILHNLFIYIFTKNNENIFYSQDNGFDDFALIYFGGLKLEKSNYLKFHDESYLVKSVCRNMDIKFHLDEFEKMKNGVYDENTCTLRLKIDMKHSNHVLRDPIAYRIKKSPHYKTKNNWCIYPSYDYSHGIIDSIENITYSYCTSEFYIRRELYYWSINKLNELGDRIFIGGLSEFIFSKVERHRERQKPRRY